ncbi:hypothetical protein B0H10DRAFT_807175 [Mycena sp. CBHHK59/15]|nr:hypothetical protein B0H10DRAFT_807175 [Mycena sp. CBHHK59/15]
MRSLCGIADDLMARRSRIRAGMPASKRAQQSRHSAQGTPAVAATAQSTSVATPISISTAAAHPPPTNPTSRVPPMPAPTSPTVPATPASKLPRFLQSPAQHDRSKSLSVDRPPSAASTSTSSSSSGGRRFLGLGKDTRERERKRIRDAERTAPSAAELLTLHENGHNTDDFEYDDVRPPGSPRRGCHRSPAYALGVALLLLPRTARGSSPSATCPRSGCCHRLCSSPRIPTIPISVVAWEAVSSSTHSPKLSVSRAVAPRPPTTSSACKETDYSTSTRTTRGPPYQSSRLRASPLILHMRRRIRQPPHHQLTTGAAR